MTSRRQDGAISIGTLESHKEKTEEPRNSRLFLLVLVCFDQNLATNHSMKDGMMHTKNMLQGEVLEASVFGFRD